ASAANACVRSRCAPSRSSSAPSRRKPWSSGSVRPSLQSRKVSDQRPSDFLEPWFVPGADNLAAMEAELALNLPHPLHSLKAHAIARRQDRDDVLFEINDHGFKLAVVHLTWRQVTETNPKWPATALFASWSQWIESMKRDHEEWS